MIDIDELSLEDCSLSCHDKLSLLEDGGIGTAAMSDTFESDGRERFAEWFEALECAPEAHCSPLREKRKMHSCLACAHLPSCRCVEFAVESEMVQMMSLLQKERCSTNKCVATHSGAKKGPKGNTRKGGVWNELTARKTSTKKQRCENLPLSSPPKNNNTPSTKLSQQDGLLFQILPLKRTRGKDKQPRRRRCGVCKDIPNRENLYPCIDPHKCGGVVRGRNKCEYFDDKEIRRCLRCKVGGGGNECSCAATRGKPDDCEHFDKGGNCK